MFTLDSDSDDSSVVVLGRMMPASPPSRSNIVSECPPQVHNCPRKSLSSGTKYHGPSEHEGIHQQSMQHRGSGLGNADSETANLAEVIVAHLDATKSCFSCGANHPFYLMYQQEQALNSPVAGLGENVFSCGLCRQAQGETTTATHESFVDNLKIKPLHDRTNTGAHKYRSETLLKAFDGAKKSASHAILWVEEATNGCLGRIDAPSRTAQDFSSLQRCNMPDCFDLLHAIEGEREIASLALRQDNLKELETCVLRELYAEKTGGKDMPFPRPSWLPEPTAARSKYAQKTQEIFQEVQSLAQSEIQEVERRWLEHWDLLEDTVLVLQSALESSRLSNDARQKPASTLNRRSIPSDKDDDPLLSYYQWRAGQRPFCNDDCWDEPPWKRKADAIMNQRDCLAAAERKSSEGMEEQLVVLPGSMANGEIEQISTGADGEYRRTRRGTGWNAVSTLSFHEDSSDDNLEHGMKPAVTWTEKMDCDLEESDQRSKGGLFHVVMFHGLLGNSKKVGDVPREASWQMKPGNMLKPPPGICTTDTKRQEPASIFHTNSVFRLPLPVQQDVREKKRSSTKALSYTYSSDSEDSSYIGKNMPPLPKRRPKPRAKRKCQRCLQFGGEFPTICNGSKGRFGRKGCEYFSGNGIPRKGK